MRYTAVFTGSTDESQGGVLCPETSKLYVMFDMPLVGDRHDLEELALHVEMLRRNLPRSAGNRVEPVALLTGAFMPRSLYQDPLEQQKREDGAERPLQYGPVKDADIFGRKEEHGSRNDS